MMARSHVPFAMSWWWTFCLITGSSVTGYGTLIAGIGGLLPDLDHPQSVLGRRLWFISLPLSALVGHRGFTHSLIAVVIMLITLVMFTSVADYAFLSWMIAPLCVGYLSHIFGDFLTPSGVPLFYPKRKNFTLNIFKTGDWRETVIVGAIGLMVFLFGGVGSQMILQLEQGLEIFKGFQNYSTYKRS